MIKINLLPQEVRAAVPAGGLAVPWRPLGIGILSLLGIYSASLFGFHQLQRAALNRLTAQWNHLEPERTRLEQTRAGLRALQNQFNLLEEVKGERSQWAPRLNLLSDALVSQLWFTSLQLEPAKSPSAPKGKQAVPASGPTPAMLFLRGSTFLSSGSAGSSEGSHAAVSRFLQRLKEQPEFSRWFQKVELRTVEHRQIAQEEVVDFVIVLYPVGGGA